MAVVVLGLLGLCLAFAAGYLTRGELTKSDSTARNAGEALLNQSDFSVLLGVLLEGESDVADSLYDLAQTVEIPIQSEAAAQFAADIAPVVHQEVVIVASAEEGEVLFDAVVSHITETSSVNSRPQRGDKSAVMQWTDEAINRTDLVMQDGNLVTWLTVYGMQASWTHDLSRIVERRLREAIAN